MGTFTTPFKTNSIMVATAYVIADMWSIGESVSVRAIQPIYHWHMCSSKSYVLALTNLISIHRRNHYVHVHARPRCFCHSIAFIPPVGHCLNKAS